MRDAEGSKGVGVCMRLRVASPAGAAQAPQRLRRLLAAEQTRYGDVHEVDVAWNETRFRGPVLSLAAWLRHAAPLAHWVVKTDDDAHLHLPRLEQLLAGLSAQLHVYLGALTWFNWRAATFQGVGSGWNFPQSNRAGAACENGMSLKHLAGRLAIFRRPQTTHPSDSPSSPASPALPLVRKLTSMTRHADWAL